jgi:phage terminase small subunit
MKTRQRVFIEVYLESWNASEAARRAGYSPRSAASIGWENLRKPEIEQEIARRIEEQVMSVNEILMRLAQQARAEYAAYIRPDGTFDLEGITREGRAHLIKSVKPTRYGLQVEFYDAQNALIQVARHQGLFAERTEATTAVMFTPETVAEGQRLLEDWRKKVALRNAAIEGGVQYGV